MNRKIKFRGKRIDDNAWVYGSLLIDYAGTCQIWEKDESGAQHNFIVDPNTLGQYTGLKDKNGKEIYEWDVVKVSKMTDTGWKQTIGKVIFKDASFKVESNYDKYPIALCYFTEIEIIDNIN